MREYLVRHRYIIGLPRSSDLGILLLSYTFLNMRSLYIDPDEGYYLLLARNLLQGQGYAFNGLPNIMMPPVVPFLIAALSLIVNSYQLSLSILTAFSGSLLGILVFLISRKRLSPGMSVAACFLSLFIFQMNAFLPLNEPYRETLYRGSDIINCLFVVAGIYFALKFAETNRGSQAALAGLSLGLSYLTRPEGVLLFLAAFCLLFLLSFVVSTKISKTKLLWFALAYIIVSMPYVAYLRSVTGRWTLSGKIGAARSYRAELLNVIQRNDWEAFKRNHYSLNKNRLEMNDWYFGYYPKDPLGKEQAVICQGGASSSKISGYIPLSPRFFSPLIFSSSASWESAIPFMRL